MPKAILTGMLSFAEKPAEYDETGKFVAGPEVRHLQPGTLIEVSKAYLATLEGCGVVRPATADEAKAGEAVKVPD